MDVPLLVGRSGMEAAAKTPLISKTGTFRTSIATDHPGQNGLFSNDGGSY